MVSDFVFMKIKEGMMNKLVAAEFTSFLPVQIWLVD